MDLKKTNSAVIKSMFIQMKKEEFITNAELVKKEYLELVPNFYNQNYERKLWEIYGFVTRFYCNYWLKKK